MVLPLNRECLRLQLKKVGLFMDFRKSISAAIPFEMLIRMVLSEKMSDPSLKLRRETLTAVIGFSKDSRKRRFLRGKAEGKEVWLPDQQANGQMRSMVGCNCLIEIPAGSGPVKQGIR